MSYKPLDKKQTPYDKNSLLIEMLRPEMNRENERINKKRWVEKTKELIKQTESQRKRDKRDKDFLGF